MNKGHCITIGLLYLIIIMGFANQRIEVINNYRMSLSYLLELNERFLMETKIINELKVWLIAVESDENYWPFKDYVHHKELNCIEYNEGDFKMMIYYESYQIFDYEVLASGNSAQFIN